MEILHAPENGKFPQMKGFRATVCGIHAKVATSEAGVTCKRCKAKVSGRA